MGMVKVMITAVVLLTILGGTIWITRWLFDKFFNIVFGKEK